MDQVRRRSSQPIEASRPVSGGGLFQIKLALRETPYAEPKPELPMSTSSSPVVAIPSAGSRGTFEVLDACHRQTVVMLDRLSELVSGLDKSAPDGEARRTAEEIIQFFSQTARQHHEDEERHVFPQLQDSDDPEIVQAVLRLQQDHHWMDVDWKELSPALAAVADNRGGYDLEVLREGVEIFTALSHDHIALEESCIYPQARIRFSSAELQQMGREMAERRRVRLARTAKPGATGS
jgi:hemerythrin-like domain-containing protein